MKIDNKEKKVLFLDMDGTTLDDKKQMSEETVDALKKASEAGHEIVVATGRTCVSAEYLRTHFGLDRLGCRYMIVYNGAGIMDCETKEMLYAKRLTMEQVHALIDVARREHIYLHTYTEDKVLTEKEDENLAIYLSRTNMEALIVPDMKKVLEEPPYKMLAINIRNPEKMYEFKEKLTACVEGKADIYFSSREYLEIVPQGVNKGAALQMFCSKKGIPLEHAIAVGDENNDISMLKAAGIGCAVANAQEDVKAAADYVTENDNNHSAVAEVIGRFVLSAGSH